MASAPRSAGLFSTPWGSPRGDIHTVILEPPFPEETEVANKNIRCLIKLELQVNNEYVFSISISHGIFGTNLYLKFLYYCEIHI